MKVLLLHDITPDDAYAGALRAAGHDIVRCAPTARAGFPCDADRGKCPLDATVEAAVVVHDRPSTDIAPHEAGAVCALRDGVPIVLAGSGAHHPFGDRVGASAAGVADVAAAVERAATARMAQLGRALGGVAERRGDYLHLTLPAGTTSEAAVLAHQAASQLAPWAHTIDVSVAHA